MRKLHIAIAFLLFSFVIDVNAQKVDCVILKDAINNKTFVNAFNICRNIEYKIVDRQVNLTDCGELVGFYRKFTISYDLEYFALTSETPGNDTLKGLLVLYRSDVKKSSCKLSFWQPETNTSLTLLYTIKGNVASLKKVEKGDF